MGERDNVSQGTHDGTRDDTPNTIPAAHTSGALRQHHPVVVFVAGQPGAGKTRIADLVQAALNRRGGAVRVGSDLYKSRHPRYAKHLREDVRTAGADVRPDVRRWQAHIEGQLRACGFDAVVESSLADPDAFRADAHAYRASGYRIEITALATPEALSQLGILSRFLEGTANGCRFVSWNHHDTCAAALPATLSVAETEQLADRITVVRRDYTMLYTNSLVDGAWTHAPAATATLLAERARPWSARETATFRADLIDTERRLHCAPLPRDHRLAVQRDSERAAALAEPVRRVAQSTPTPPGIDYHRLSTNEHRWIFDHLIIRDLGTITAHRHPIAVYVMGQPGSGKTRTATLVQRGLHHRHPTRIAAEHFKAAHPDYVDVLGAHPRTAGERIRADYHAGRDQAQAHVRAHSGDMVIETSPDSADAFTHEVALFRQAGYGVELVVVATRAADSRQGTAVRYAETSRTDAARMTTIVGHDRCLFAVLEAVAAAEREAPVDAVTIMRRDHTTVYHNKRDTEGRWEQAPRAVTALLAEHERLYTQREAAAFLTIQRTLLAALPQHRVELDDITRLATTLMPPSTRPRPLAPFVAARLPVPVTHTAPAYVPRSETSLSHLSPTAAIASTRVGPMSSNFRPAATHA